MYIDKNRLREIRTKCCNSELYNNGFFKDKFVCGKCFKKNIEIYYIDKWEEIAPCTYRLKVKDGYLYDRRGSKTYPGGVDVTHNILFVKE